MASIWKGSISFGLVNIPVSLQTAVKDESLHFRMLEKGSLSPIKYEKVSKKTGLPVSIENIVKGYEYEKNSFVEITREDFAKAAEASLDTFEIEDFVPESDIDPRFFEKPYFVVPEKGADKPYVLLRDAMKDSGMVGIGRITLRNKQYLASIKPIGPALVLDVMRFENELISEREYKFPERADLKAQEISLAKQLISQHSTEFDPSKYTDNYQANLRKIIDAKLKGFKATIKKSDQGDRSGLIDLMERLKASLAAQDTQKAKGKYRSTKASKLEDDLEKGQSSKKKSKKAKQKSTQTA